MYTKDEQLGKGAASGAGKAIVTKVIQTLLNDAQIGNLAQETILLMQKHLFSKDAAHDFISPLRKTGFHLGKEPFKKAETIHYLGHKVAFHHQQLSVLTNNNLKEAATLLWDLHCQIAMHIIHRQDTMLERSDADYSYVLMYLQESITIALEQICNAPELADADIVALKTKLVEGISNPFHAYIQGTQAQQSAGARRTAIDHILRASIDGINNALERFVTEKPLRTSIEALQQTTQRFNGELKQLLLALVLVPLNEGEKQQDAKWVLHRKMMLAKAAESDSQSILINLCVEETKTIGYQGKSGILYKNPFAHRVQMLCHKPVTTQEQCYFNYIMQLFTTTESPLPELMKYAEMASAFDLTYSHLPNSNNFLLPDMLREGIRDIDFIHTAEALYRQSHELTRFMASLQHFMQFVGKLGLYNNEALHGQLTQLIQAASACFEQNLAHIQQSIKQGDEARVGGWLNPLEEMMQQLKDQGHCIIQEMRVFQTHFAKIIDPIAMQIEFNKSKTELLQAALSLGHASALDPKQMTAISDQIGRVELVQFSKIAEGVNVTKRLDEILTLAQDMGGKLEAAEAELNQTKMQFDNTLKELERVRLELAKDENALLVSGEHLQLRASELLENTRQSQTKLAELDNVVETFSQHIKHQLMQMNDACLEDVREANQLIAAATATLASSSTQALTDHMTLLSKLKGRLEERQKGYQLLVQAVTAFQTEYAAKRGTLSLKLTSVQDIARDIDITVRELNIKINALTDIILSLRQTLEEKDKLLIAQKLRLGELESQLASLRERHSRSPESTCLTNSFRSDLQSRRTSTLSALESNRQSNRSFSAGSFLQTTFKSPANAAALKVNRIIECYRTDILRGTLVRNVPRKVIKYAIWCELMEIIFESKAIQHHLPNPKALIITAIQNLKTQDFLLQAYSETYSFNKIVGCSTDEEIYAEFTKGKLTHAALNELDPTFLTFIEEHNDAYSEALSKSIAQSP